MTTFGISGLGQQQYGTSTGKTQETKEAKPSAEEGKVAGHRPPPPPPPKNQDTYVPSDEGLASLVEDALESADVATTEITPDAEADKETSYQMDKEAVAQLKADFAQQQQNFYNSMISNIKDQAGSALKAAGLWDKINLGDYEVTPEMQAEAQEAISEDGYWGVEQTANRIVDMAKALAGGDADKADELMAAIEKGFAAAEDVWGSELPSITGDTKARIDELFAEWKDQ